MKLSDFVVTEASVPALAAQERDEAVAQIVRSLVRAGTIARADERSLVHALIEREKSGSTGFGKGVAVPHVKHEKVEHMVAAIGISPGGIEFKALDDAVVHTVIVLISPADRPDEHLQAMETLFSNLQREPFRRSLRQATTSEQIEQIIAQADAGRQLV